MTIPTISALPTPPSRSDPTNFAVRADIFVAAFPTLRDEINAFAAAILAAAAGTNYNCTSSSSVAIGTGTKSFTASTGSLLQVGQYVIVSSTASPANYMIGQVTAYNATTGALTVNVIATGGSGTIASWTISLTIDPALALPRAGDGVVGSPGIAFSGDADTGIYRPGADRIGVATGGVQRVEVDASGNVGIGAPPLNNTRLRVAGGAGMAIDANAIIGSNLYFDAGWKFIANGWGGAIKPSDSTDGGFNIFISTASNSAGAGATATVMTPLRAIAAGAVPGVDNSYSLGIGSFRWSTVYAATGTINTSDERAKQDIGAIPDECLDAWGDVDWQRYKFIDAVQAKGDDARWHIGLVAQQVRDSFAARDLDAQTIGLLCYDEWDEQTEPVYETVEIPAVLDDGGNEIEPARIEQVDTGGTRVTLEAGDRWGLRYDECQAMEAAWQRRELARKDVLIADLSARLAALEAA